MPPRRPTAFDVSFPEEAENERRTQAQKRKADAAHADPRPGKRPTPEDHRSARRGGTSTLRAFYTPHAGDILEQPHTHIFGEDPPDDEDVDDRPVRVLNDFVLFDPAHANELVSPALIESDDGVAGREFEGAGVATPYYVNEEDEGLDEDDEDEDGEGDRGMRLRLSAVLAVYIDYSKLDDPIYITTSHAWYILRMPSPHYKEYYADYYRVHKTLQWLISTALAAAQISYADFMEEFGAGPDDVIGRRFDVRDIKDAAPQLQFAIETLADNLKGPDDTHARRSFISRLLNHTLISHVLDGQNLHPQASSSQGPSRSQPQRRRTLTHLQERLRGSNANRDDAVLRPEQQNPTHVTPLISLLAADLFRESLVVVGAKPAQPTKAMLRRRREREQDRIIAGIVAALKPNTRVHAVKEWQLHRGSEFLSKIQVNDTIYAVGDVVIIAIGEDEDEGRSAPALPDNPQEVPSDAILADYFWFARIVHIQDGNTSYTVHLQWFEHSSRTLLGEISDPKELFLTNICSTAKPESLAGKVKARQLPSEVSTLPNGDDQYFYKFMYNKKQASFTSIPPPLPEDKEDPTNNCPACLFSQAQEELHDVRHIPNENSVVYKDITYHVHDFVYVRSTNGPCSIAQIRSFTVSQRRHGSEVKVDLKMLGLITSIASILPPDMARDERHVFLTDEKKTVPVEDLLQVCYVSQIDCISDLETWCSAFTDQFYVQYHFPTLSPRSWNLRKAVVFQELPVCEPCCHAREGERQEWELFNARPPLHIFDPFAGVGAFGMGMELAGGMETTHAIEISPSAAITLKKNMPGTVVYNQCANTVLQYSIKSQMGHLECSETPTQLYDDVTKLGPPPAPGSADIIIAGFPCQPHSGLNMFQKANDKKSNLILNLLSWVDLMKPTFCVFENVKGFLSFNLNAFQKDQYQTEGGITMGGLKFVYRAMLAMNYQVCCALLQGAHYGLPQTRVRFFMIAAKRNHILPDLPAPTHDFPHSKTLAIKFPTSKHPVQPIITERGTAPLQAVTVDNAISDLPMFDWKHSKHHSRTPINQIQGIVRRSRVKAFDCDQTKPWIGIEGRTPLYHTPPLTTFQKFCRQKDTTDIQHYTRTLKPAIVDRVLSIPLVAGADYRVLPKELWEWQFSDPTSAVARGGFRPGLYGRIDKDGFFQTTVTNMEVTAKQSRVLHPYCFRTVSVRELARSQGFPDHFVFHSENNNVKTMHRQIGNAVPLPLGLALGREIRKAEFKKWQTDM